MARRLDRVVVVDVESTCWEGDPPPGEESEIVEVGVCLLDPRSGAREGPVSVLVRPERSQVSAFCTRLTTLRPEDVAGGVGFPAACKRLRTELGTPQRVFASYGDYDRRMFERQCAARGVAYPFGPTHLNVKSLFALRHGLAREVGMDAALDLAGLPLEGTHHRGGDDAWNVAALLAQLLRPAPTA